MDMSHHLNLGFAYLIGHGLHVVDDFGNLVYLWGEPAYQFHEFFTTGLPDFYGQ
jgi:hypothetical protein